MPIKIVKKSKHKYKIYPDPSRESPNELFGIRNFVALAVGPPGSGKTNCVISLLTGPYYKKFKRIFYISPTIPDQKVTKVLKLPEERYANDTEAISDFMVEGEGIRKCVVIDDAITMFNNSNSDTLNNLVVASHHYKSSMFIVTHSLSTTPPLIKKSCHVIILCRGITNAELKSLALYLKGGITIEEVNEAYAYCEKASRPLILLSTGKMLCGFDFIKLSEK